jgi:CRISPR-associated endoribonuclease Cas6
MLLSVVVRLVPMQESTIPADQGRATYGLFLSWLRQADSALAQELHDIEGIKPFTVSDLQGTGRVLSSSKGRRVRGEITLDPQQPVWWRVTTLTPRLSQVVLEQVLPKLPDQLTLADQAFQVVGATVDGTEHPWAGQTSYEELAQRHLLGAEEPSPWLNLEFATPTTFRSQGKHLPLPLPGLVFDHWLSKWNRFAPLSLHPDVKRFAEECLAVSRYRLRSRVVRFGPATFIGFVGRCSFRALRRDPYWLRLLHTLAAYAFYCGTGHKTTMGMGQTKVQSPKSKAQTGGNEE